MNTPTPTDSGVRIWRKLRAARATPPRRAVSPPESEEIDSAVRRLETGEIDAVRRFIGIWERARWVSPPKAAEWRRRLSARKLFLKLFPGAGSGIRTRRRRR